MGASRRTLHAVGITGGIGSGKSAVCAILERQGIPVLSADRSALDLASEDPALRRRIARLLGPESYLPDGTYNRPYVAERIFSDRRLQRGLEAILHPAVDRDLRSRMRALSAEGHRLAAVEAALIYESGMDAWLDAVVVVEAPEAVRVARVAARDNVGPEAVLVRMRAQMAPAEKRRRADYVIVNDGTTEELERNVVFILGLLRTIVEKG